jgi:hypothetical protein
LKNSTCFTRRHSVICRARGGSATHTFRKMPQRSLLLLPPSSSSLRLQA